MKTYTTVQGDMWDNIAVSQLGGIAYMDALIKVNSAYRKVLVFSSGVVLNLPEVNSRITADDLPPWKKVSG